MEVKVKYDKKVKWYDFTQKPRRQAWWTMLIIWSVSYIVLKWYRVKIRKINMEGMKPPYILLCNHMQFLDFMVAYISHFPYRINNIVSIDGYNISPFLLRSIGSIPKRKFSNDLYLIKNIRYVLNDLRNIVGIYPEARYSFVGTTSVLPDSLGKLVKLTKCPVVFLKFEGHHLQLPTWAKKSRKVKVSAEMRPLFSTGDIENYSAAEINDIIRKSFDYNEYDYQKKHHILISEKYRAEGLHKALYKCPACGEEFQMDSQGVEIFCKKCRHVWLLQENGELSCTTGETRFSTIPAWYDWQRKNCINTIRL